VRLEGVSKRFVLQHHKARSFQELVVNLAHRRNGGREEFWALRDVSLSVAPGETLGIIGENGSGKSTLLKLISGILEPTAGRVRVEGKVSALIELGAGFHPDLTGRENIYLNGAILGLGRREMARRFEEIVAFAELERFIDTPVKHYSSGMYMRLGFAVAISVDPDILIVDEVLAVGDEAFQRKCLERIADLRRRGTTVIFVSHVLPLVEQLCDRAVWLERGVIRARGDARAVVRAYQTAVECAAVDGAEGKTGPAGGPAAVPAAPAPPGADGTASPPGLEVRAVRLLDADGTERYSFRTGETLVARLSYQGSGAVEAVVLGIAVRRSDGLLVYRADSGPRPAPAPGETAQAEVVFPDLPLLPGTYDLTADAWPAGGRPPGELADGPACRFSVWSDRAEAGIVALSPRWTVGGTAAPAAAGAAAPAG
ncbi:MAG: ABC transporter ATP-binding protein, partial [Chloroflexi bacterium]|nr:ABC transporter ATP-binding protein [Chloroflexota bacterium]